MNVAPNHQDTSIVVQNLTKKYDDLLVLDDISFTVGQGEMLCIVGPTGCGKTTFLHGRPPRGRGWGATLVQLKI